MESYIKRLEDFRKNDREYQNRLEAEIDRLKGTGGSSRAKKRKSKSP
jgi:hypothetical protein